MMKSSFQKSNFLYYGIILVSVWVEVIMIWQLEKLIPLLYPGFIGFLVFHLLYHLLLFLVSKRSGRLDYLMIWGLFLMFNLLYDSFLGLLFLGLSFGMWCVFDKILAISTVLTSLLYSMKIKEQTRKLAAGCSKYSFEVADKADVVWRDFRRVLVRFFFYTNLVTHFNKLVAFSF